MQPPKTLCLSRTCQDVSLVFGILRGTSFVVSTTRGQKSAYFYMWFLKRNVSNNDLYQSRGAVGHAVLDIWHCVTKTPERERSRVTSKKQQDFKIRIFLALSGTTPRNTRPLHRSKAFESQIPYKAVNFARIPNEILLVVQNNRRTKSFFVTGQRCVPPQPFIENDFPPLNSWFGVCLCPLPSEKGTT